MVKIKVEIPPYLVKFLTKSYGLNFNAKKSSSLGNVLMDYLQKDYARPSVKNDSSTYVFYLSNELSKKYGSFISSENHGLLIKKLDSLFKAAMNGFVNVSVAKKLEYTRLDKSNLKQSRYVAFQQFLEYYDISDDDGIRFDSIYRNDQRRRKILDQQNKAVKKERKPRRLKKITTNKALIVRNKIRRKKTTTKTIANQPSLFG